MLYIHCLLPQLELVKLITVLPQRRFNLWYHNDIRYILLLVL